jgi:cytochrome c553
MKRLLPALGLVVVMIASWAVALPASKAPENVVLNAATSKRAPVPFPHALHVTAVESCVACHHNHEGLTAKSNVDVKTCASCHLKPEKAGVPNISDMSLTKNAYHINCITCHKEKAKGPTKCNDCHAK